MILRIINLVLLACVITNAFWLIGKRFQSRTDYTTMSELNGVAEELSREYTKLQIEEGTFSSDWVLKDFAVNKLGLIEPDKKHLMGVK